MSEKCIESVPYILFADDSADTLDLLKYHCEYRGWKGDYVSTAREIITKVNENSINDRLCYDVIVADINYFNTEENLPKLTGITAAIEIRKVYENIPIVFISAFAGYLIKEQIKEVNAILVPKPFDAESLFVKLYQLVRWSRYARTLVFEGEDKRVNSINRSRHQRRITDRKLTIPSTIDSVLTEVRAQKIMSRD